MFLWIFLILGAYYLYTTRNHQTQGFGRKSDAAELLDIRYAKGEIDEETYLRMKSNLDR